MNSISGDMEPKSCPRNRSRQRDCRTTSRPRSPDLGHTPATNSVSGLLLPLIPPPRRIRFEHPLDLIPHPPKHRELLAFRPHGMRWIVEREMMPIHLPGKHRAGLIGVAADGDH